MPKPYPQEFRDDVVRVARNREPGVTIEQIAADFGVHPMTLTKWMRRAAVDDGERAGSTRAESEEVRELRRRNRLLEQEVEVLGRAAAYLSQANLPGKGSTRSRASWPRTDSCRGDVPGVAACSSAVLPVVGGSRLSSEVVRAYRANALFDAHRDDPEFGYRLLVDEARDAGEPMADRTAWTIASDNGWWSVFGKKRGRTGKKPGPAVHDDLCTMTDDHGRVRHVFTTEAPNRLWLTDITEHNTAEGKLYLCAVKDVLRTHRGVLDRLPNEVAAGSVGVRERGPDAWRRGRLCPAFGSGIAISEPEAASGVDPPRHGRVDGQSRFLR